MKELIALIIQILIFYLIPLFGLDNPMGMVLLIAIITFIISILVGIISDKKIKYLYPLMVSLLFIPSVFIFYNESALVHSIWYLIISYIGIIIGSIFKK